MAVEAGTTDTIGGHCSHAKQQPLPREPLLTTFPKLALLTSLECQPQPATLVQCPSLYLSPCTSGWRQQTGSGTPHRFFSMGRFPCSFPPLAGTLAHLFKHTSADAGLCPMPGTTAAAATILQGAAHVADSWPCSKSLKDKMPSIYFSFGHWKVPKPT